MATDRQNGDTLCPEVLALIDDETYAQAAELPCFGLYHTVHWHSVLNATFGWPVSAVVARDAAGLAGFLPFVRKRRMGRRLAVALPLSHRVAPLARNDDGTLARILAEAIAPVDVHHAVPGGEPMVTLVESRLSIAEAGDDDALKAKLSKGIRRDIRDAIKAGCVLETRTDPDAFAIFADMQTLTRRRQGAPDYPAAFFPALARHLAPKGLAKVHLCLLDGRPVAGTVTLAEPGGSTIYYGYGASLPDPETWKKRVNQFALWGAMCDARARGAAIFSFGSTPIAQEPLRQYKERFGGISEELPHTRFGLAGSDLTAESPAAKLGAEVLQRMPVAVFRATSPWLMRAVL